MKRFLWTLEILCVLWFLAAGCGKSPETREAASDKSAQVATTPAESEFEEDVEVATKAEEVSAEAGEVAAKIEETAAKVKEEAQQMDTELPKTAGKVADVIEMNTTQAFSTRKMAIVQFTHKKHADAAPDGHGIACGECHHDQEGKPLELKKGDAVQRCFKCHNKPGKPTRPREMSAEDWNALRLEYYHGAIHANCVECHKTAGAGPVKCSECHVKREK